MIYISEMKRSGQRNSQNQQNLSFLRHKPFLIQKPSRLVFTVQKGFCLWSYYGQFWIFWRTRHKSTRFFGLYALPRCAEQFQTLGPSLYFDSLMAFWAFFVRFRALQLPLLHQNEMISIFSIEFQTSSQTKIDLGNRLGTHQNPQFAVLEVYFALL